MVIIKNAIISQLLHQLISVFFKYLRSQDALLLTDLLSSNY